MTKNNYIVAIEVGSSKISGAIGIHTVSGVRILAYASEPVSNFISKGVIRNVDETGNSLTSLINRLETQIENIHIEKAYVTFGGMSMHSIKSSVTREFESFTKITQEIIDEISLENESIFNVPDGYQKIQVVPQEYRLNGETSAMPIGTPTCRIECNFLNIIIREQYMKQLEESFEMAKIKIADSFNAAKIEADLLLSDEELTAGTALVNIGADTTTVAIYTNRLLRKITVIPLGSANITKDLCAEQITITEAEQIKIFKGYRADEEEHSNIPTELLNEVISGRMIEILQNIKYQIESSGENIGRIVFTGGGSKLKNISAIIEDNLPNYRIRIATDIEMGFTHSDELPITTGAITPTLFGLLSKGEENCCEEEITAPKDAVIQNDLFEKEKKEDEIEKPVKKEDEKKEGISEITGKENQKLNKKRNNPIDRIKTLFGDWIDNVTEEEDDSYKNNNDEEL